MTPARSTTIDQWLIWQVSDQQSKSVLFTLVKVVSVMDINLITIPRPCLYGTSVYSIEVVSNRSLTKEFLPNY